MASQKQIDANRKNSELCCGPRTIAGKAVSSQNALKTGIDSKSEVMRCESRADHEQLIAEYYARFRPTLPEERALVDLLIKSEWLSRRYMSVECAIWERGFVDAKENSLTRVFERSGEAFCRVDRRINSAQRDFQKALKQLTELRAKRNADLEVQSTEPAEVAQTDVTTEPLNPKLVSFLTNDSAPETPPAPPTENSLEKEDDPPIAA